MRGQDHPGLKVFVVLELEWFPPLFGKYWGLYEKKTIIFLKDKQGTQPGHSFLRQLGPFPQAGMCPASSAFPDLRCLGLGGHLTPADGEMGPAVSPAQS